MTKRSAIGCALLVLLFVAARLWRLTEACLWFDEIFSVHAARHSWAGLLAFASADLIHPPLFYLLLKLWIFVGGESLVWLRLFPVLTACAALVPFFLLCRELRLSPAETNLSLLLIAVNGYLIHYAQMIRMYSLLALLALCSLWLFARFERKEESGVRSLVALFVVNLLLVYTHYYGWLVVATELFYLLVWRRRRVWPFVWTQALVFVCFLPWAFVVVRAATRSAGLAQNIGWTPRPGLFAVARFFSMLNEPLLFREALSGQRILLWSVLYLAVFAVPVALWLVRAVKSSAPESVADARRLRLLLLFAGWPLAGAFVLSHALPQSIWGARHLIVIAIPYLVLAAVALRRLPDWIRGTLCGLFACWALIAGFSLLLKQEARPVWCAWDDLAAPMALAEPDAAGPVKIYTFEDLTAYHLWFALDTLHEKRFRLVVLRGLPGLLEDTSYFLPRGFDEVARGDPASINEESFWVAFRDESWNPEKQPLKTLIERGYRVGQRLEADGHGFKAFVAHVSRR